MNINGENIRECPKYGKINDDFKDRCGCGVWTCPTCGNVNEYPEGRGEWCDFDVNVNYGMF